MDAAAVATVGGSVAVAAVVDDEVADVGIDVIEEDNVAARRSSQYDFRAALAKIATT